MCFQRKLNWKLTAGNLTHFLATLLVIQLDKKVSVEGWFEWKVGLEMSCGPFQPGDVVICRVMSSRALTTEGNLASAGQQGNMGQGESQNHRIIE